MAKLPLKTEKKKAVGIAKDLCYSSAVIEEIQNATSTNEITKILRKARLA